MKIRNYSIDILKIIAAYGVISIHVPHDTALAHSFAFFFIPLCVPFFYLSSLYFFIKGLKSHNKSLSHLWQNWKMRLILPYLCWTGIYMLLFGVQYLITHKTHGFNFWSVLLFGSSTEHLYFIPKLVAMQVLATAIFFLFKRNVKISIPILLLALYTIYWILGISLHSFTYSWGEFLGSPILVGLAFLFQRPSFDKILSRKTLFIGIIMALAASFLSIYGIQLSVMNYSFLFPMGAVGMLLIGLSAKVVKMNLLLFQLSGLTYGIYLFHVLAIEFWELLATKILHINLIYNFPTKIAETTIIFFCSAILLYYLKKWSFFNSYFLGEYKN